jgi:hypothetical protein
MAAPATRKEDSDLGRQEIESSLRSIVESADKWLERLKRRQQRIRLATAFLTTVLAFVIFAASVLFVLLLEGKFVPGPPPPQFFPLVGLSGIVALVCGAASYFLLKRKHEAELKNLETLVVQMKKEREGGTTTDALSLADKIISLLPTLVRKRSQDSLIYGVVAFLLSLALVRFPPGALLIGVIVWLYFRHENIKTYEKEISRFDEQRRVFEQRKKDFLETL